MERNEIMPFAIAWMDLELVILSEVSQRKIHDIAYMRNLIKVQKLTYQQNRVTGVKIKTKNLMVTWEQGRE